MRPNLFNASTLPRSENAAFDRTDGRANVVENDDSFDNANRNATTAPSVRTGDKVLSKAEFPKSTNASCFNDRFFTNETTASNDG